MQALKRDQAAEATGLASPHLRSVLPALEVAPLRTAPVVTPPPPDRAQQATKLADARRNWLLAGFEQTEHPAVGTTPPERTGAAGKVSEEELDPADPNYFLKVYERQRSVQLANRPERPSAAAGISTGQDPFAPLMQEWLAGSPVRETLNDILRPRSTQPNEVSITVASGERVSSRTGTTTTLLTVTSGPANLDREVGNPYLEAFDLSTARADGLAELNVPAAAPASAALPQNPGTKQFTLPALPKVESRRNGPPDRTDDKKYFPQLKKF
ncbi:MAG: hypothetical protein Q8J74_13920 [Candidatus Didemnitutus sp.]|nr:hypothetical protein [Candidatus Didemnitutus sp.]